MVKPRMALGAGGFKMFSMPINGLLMFQMSAPCPPATIIFSVHDSFRCPYARGSLYQRCNLIFYLDQSECIDRGVVGDHEEHVGPCIRGGPVHGDLAKRIEKRELARCNQEFDAGLDHVFLDFYEETGEHLVLAPDLGAQVAVVLGHLDESPLVLGQYEGHGYMYTIGYKFSV